jgi:ABC-2 type transport system ATP-binding protein
MGLFLLSPYMEEPSRCHRLGFMRNGVMIAEGTPSALCARLEGQILEITTREPLRLRTPLLAIAGVEDARPFGDRLHVRIQKPSVNTVVKEIEQLPGHPVANLISPSLEDVFLSLTKNQEVTHG